VTAAAAMAAGARNLLVDCGEFEAGDEVLIVHEDPALGWYDLAAPMAVAFEARRLGLRARLLQVGGPGNGRQAALEIADHANVVFFARIGDQDRFAEAVAGRTVVMSYARDGRALGSAYGQTSHKAMLALKAAVDEVLLGADRIDIACPLGTRVSGTLAPQHRHAEADVSVRRFPMGVPQPVAADRFSGRVALGRWLTPTGSRVYAPASVELEAPVFARIDAGRIVEFEGDAAVVAKVRAHYDHVAGLFGIDRDAVHSWHAGIHPASDYPHPPEADPDRWSNSVFTSPRWLHFHTCGAYAPGEICWMVGEPKVEVDGKALWREGRLWLDRPGVE
jgi:hypothetical protein